MMQAVNDREAARESEPEDARHRQVDGDGRGRERPGGLVCASCATEVPEGARSCPVCHRGVYRSCFCGWQLPATEAACPNCGADWSQSARVARRAKSRSAKNRTVLRYAVLGALSAMVVALVFHVAVIVFAGIAANEQGGVPSGFGERLDLALGGLARLLGQIGGFFVRHSGTLVVVLGIMVVGALAGVAVYVLQRRGTGHHTSRTSRRVRRKRRK